MPKKPFNEQNEAPLDAVLEELRQNSESLRKVLNNISSIRDAVDATRQDDTEKIVAKLELLQNEIKRLADALQTRPDEVNSLPSAVQANQAYPTVMNPPAILRCNSWDEFMALACNSEMISFTFRELDRLFEVDAAKNGQIFVYVGEMPKIDSLLKAWLTSQLIASPESVFEGVIKTK